MFKIATLTKFRKIQARRNCYTKAKKTSQGGRKRAKAQEMEGNMDPNNVQQSNNVRKWESTKLFNDLNKDNLFNEARQNHTIFKIMSYNVLAQDLLDGHRELYRKINQRYLNWNHRKMCLLNEIRSAKPDILCIQEMQTNHLDSFAFELSQQFNYDRVFKKRTGDKTDGCVIFYNADMFQMLDFRTIEFNQRISLLDRDNVGIILKLCCRSDPSSVLVVATTHLLFNPRRLDIKLAQVHMLLAELEQMAFITGDNKYHPMILTGDFNMLPFSAPYKLIVDGRLDYNKLPHKNHTNRAIISQELGITDNCQHLHSVRSEHEQVDSQLYHSENPRGCWPHIRDSGFIANYEHLFNTGFLSHQMYLSSVTRHVEETPKLHGSTYQDQWITVDFLFYSKYFNRKFNRTCEGHLKLLKWHDLPTVAAFSQMDPIPSQHLGSDHLSLSAEFLLKSQHAPLL